MLECEAQIDLCQLCQRKKITIHHFVLLLGIPFYKILQCQLSGRAARATFPLTYYLRIFLASNNIASDIIINNQTKMLIFFMFKFLF